MFTNVPGATNTLIDWGLTPLLTISQLYHVGQFTFSCISWFSHTSTPHNNLPKQLAAFPHRLSPLVEDKWRMSHWALSIVGKKVGRAGIRTHIPWIDSPRRYRVSYRDSALIPWQTCYNTTLDVSFVWPFSTYRSHLQKNVFCSIQ